MCFVALDSGEETNFKKHKGNKIMITDLTLPRQKQMHVYSLFESARKSVATTQQE